MEKPIAFLRIRNFERFQHYRDRRPPWIKLYRDLWDDPRFFCLCEDERYVLLSLFVVASQNNNHIPNNPAWLARQCLTSLRIITRTLQALSVGTEPWIEESLAPDDIKPLADCNQVDALERERETEGEIQNTETEGEIPQPPLLVFGEFGWVKITAEQHQNLKAQLNGKFEDYVARFDGWVQEAPTAKTNGVRRKDRNPYASIQNWHRKDAQTNGTTAKTKTELNAEAGRRALAALNSQNGG